MRVEAWSSGVHRLVKVGSPSEVQREWRKAREQVPGLPEDFRFHDLRHFLASYLIASGADIKAVQARMRHASATVTLNVYSHLMPKSADATVDLIDAALSRPGAEPTGRPGGGASGHPDSGADLQSAAAHAGAEAVAGAESVLASAVGTVGREPARGGHLRVV